MDVGGAGTKNVTAATSSLLPDVNIERRPAGQNWKEDNKKGKEPEMHFWSELFEGFLGRRLSYRITLVTTILG